MADFWETPKTDWMDNDGIGFEDLNRIESNISANRDGNFRKVQGFGYTINNTVIGEDGVVTVLPGSAYSSNGIPIKMAANFVKNLTTFAVGNGATFGGMAAAVTAAANTWYYIFVIMDPTDGSTEIQFDDNPAGTNITSGIFTEKRFIHSFKTGAAGGDGSFDLVEMYAIDDHVFINPDSMYPNDHGINHSGPSDDYSLITLTEGGFGFALPARDVRADLNISADRSEFGVISAFGGHFTVPASFVNSGLKTGEFIQEHVIDTTGSNVGSTSGDCAIMVPSDRKINIALLFTSGTGDTIIAVRGFHDDRLQ